MPTPMMTTSTSFIRCAMFGSLREDLEFCRDIRIEMDMLVAVLAKTHGFADEFHTVLINGVVVVGVGARKSDHSPGRHVAIATVDGIGKEAFNCHLEQHVEENGGRNAVQLCTAAPMTSETHLVHPHS